MELFVLMFVMFAAGCVVGEIIDFVVKRRRVRKATKISKERVEAYFSAIQKASKDMLDRSNLKG